MRPIDNETLMKAADVLDARSRKINRRYILEAAKHIIEIGQMIPTDIHRITEMRRMSVSLSEIETDIAEMVEEDEADVETLMLAAAEGNSDFQRVALGHGGEALPIMQNRALLQTVKAVYDVTKGSLDNLSRTTIDDTAYRSAIDRAIFAAHMGGSSYGSEIRRAITELAQAGLTVTYPSGVHRRLDTAVRQNVLDGMRYLNQRVSEQVGEEFGADGVEIDAHMLCAEDHLPYQGQQFSKEEFQDIQDSLARPFGEWNCRHSWQPILLGISPRRYTDDQLREMKEYSTEPIEIDGVTKTRYEWSQVQRRLEVKARQQNDVTEALRSVGNKEGARQSDAAARDIVSVYDRVSGKAGLDPQYTRMRSAVSKADYSLTDGVNSDRIANEDDEIWHAVTDESISSVPKFTEFANEGLNQAVENACKKILLDIKDDELGTEETVSIRVSDLKTETRKGESGEGTVQFIKMDKPYVAIHNHPSNESFTYLDIESFIRDNPCVGMVAVGNNGKNCYALIKSNIYDANGAFEYYIRWKYGYVSFKSEIEFLKGAEDYGLHYIGRAP